MVLARVARVSPHDLDPGVLLAAVSSCPEAPDVELARLVASIGIQLARALSVVHRRGRVHGAIDADHVLLDGRGRARLLAADPGAVPARAGPADDVDRLARVLASLVDGREHPPEGPLAPPRTIESDTRRELWTVLDKATRRRRGYAHAIELAADLQRLLDGEPVLARRPDALVLGGRWLVRQRRAVAALGLVALLGGLVLDLVSPRLARAWERADHVAAVRARADAALRAHDGDMLRRCGVELVAHAPVEARLMVALATALDAPGRLPPPDALPPATTPHEARLRARLERMRGEPGPALEAIEQALTLWPDDASLLAERAWALVEAGDHEAAHAAIGRLREVGRAGPSVLMLAARCQLELGLLGEAGATLARLPRGVDDVDVMATELARRLGPAEHAETATAALIERLPGHERAWAQRLALAPEEAAEGLARLRAGEPGPRRLDLLRAFVRLGSWDEAAALAEDLAASRADGFLWWCAVLHWDRRPEARDAVLATWHEAHPGDFRPEALAGRWAAQAEEADAVLDAGLAEGRFGPGRRRQIAAWFALDGREEAWSEALRPARFDEQAGLGWYETAAFWPGLAVHDPAGVLERLAPVDKTAPAREVVLRARLRRDLGEPDAALALVEDRLQAGLLRGRDVDVLQLERDRLRAAARGLPPGPPDEGPLNVCTSVLLSPRLRVAGGEDDAPGALLGGVTPRLDEPAWLFEGPYARGPGLVVDVDLGWALPLGRLVVAARSQDRWGRARAWTGTVEVHVRRADGPWTPVPAHEPHAPDPEVVERTLAPGTRGRWVRVRLLPDDPAARFDFAGLELLAPGEP